VTDSNEHPDDRIAAALARLGAEHEPPVGWEARVMAAVDGTRRRWWVYAAPGAALAAAAAVALIVVRRPPPALALNVDIKHSALYRGNEASPGDIAHIVVQGGKSPRAIWVYHEEVKLVLRCPGDPRCRISDDSTEVDLTLSSAGTYTVVALTAASGLPALGGSYDADTAAAKDAGLEVRQFRLAVQ
jgi:hypothetical protein